jgi:hypothetical protein
MNPFASIWEDRPTSTATAQPKAAAKPKKTADHSAARALYQRLLARKAELAPYREYAKAVVYATADRSGKTPVCPLATMGTNGGPLLCDHCGQPMILEGGAYNKVYADAAWERNKTDRAGWVSYISRGMVVEITTNGTLRIYHGYTSKPGECCTLGKATENASDEAFTGKAAPGILNALALYLREEFPDLLECERCDIVSAVSLTLFSFDPGFGINRPK